MKKNRLLKQPFERSRENRNENDRILQQDLFDTLKKVYEFIVLRSLILEKEKIQLIAHLIVNVVFKMNCLILISSSSFVVSQGFDIKSNLLSITLILLYFSLEF